MGTKLRYKISSNKDFTFVRLWIRSEYKSSVLFKTYLKTITDDYCKTCELSTIWEWYLNINDILRGLAASCFYNITSIVWCLFSSKRCIYLSYRFVIYQCILSVYCFVETWPHCRLGIFLLHFLNQSFRWHAKPVAQTSERYPSLPPTFHF